MFCELNDNELPEGFLVTPTLSDTGDECHREIDNVGNGALKKRLRAKRGWGNFYICDGAGARPLTQDDFHLLK